MGAYRSAIITTTGQNLIAQALAGSNAVKFAALKTSNYSYPASTNFEALTSLQGVKQSTGITSAIVVNQTTVKISARVSNVGITTAYYINTIGVYAETDGITETLIAVIPASTADLVPAYSTGAPYSFIYDINLTIQNSTSLNVTINDSGVATVADLRHFFEKTYDVYVTDTASGEIASFEDGADKIPMESVNVSMTPRQSFNGYDKPWAGGAEKNKLQVTATSQTINGVTFTVNSDGTVKANGTATAAAEFPITGSLPSADFNEKILNGCPSGGDSSTYRIFEQVQGSPWLYLASDFGNGTTLPTTTYQNIRFVIRVESGQTVNNIVFKPMVRLASVSDATYSPYSNICPISGWNAVKVTRSGKNLIDENAVYHYDIYDGKIYTDMNISASYVVRVNKNTNYTVSFRAANRARIFGTGEVEPANDVITTSTILDMFSVSADHYSFNSGDNSYLLVILGVNFVVTNPQLEVGSTATAYEPYTDNTYTVTFPSETGTVYGGTVDIANGELTVTDANIASYNGETLPGEWLSSYDKYAEGATPTTGAQVVYKLATPQTIQLSPTEIDSLYGYNNVWSDVGNVDVKYRADTTLYINKKIAEMQALILENS